MGGVYRPRFHVRRGPLFFAWVALLLVAVIWTDFSINSKSGHVCVGLMVLGSALNTFAVRLNGGRMPVRADVIPPDYEQTHRPMDGRTRVRILGDWIAFRRSLYSPGNVSILAGQAVLLGWALCCFATKYAGVSL
jgi:Family of unknown function (DUF5317)